MKNNLQQIKQLALPILQAAGVTRSAIFGSYVRNEANEKSDIDLLINFPAEKSLLELIGLELSLTDALGRDVDLVEYDSLRPQIKDSVLKESVTIL
ncbi:MAG: hypothetical protein CEO22_531 [Candidatus Berkelbacteria bacterium Gr01-1014_85]|uniref:Polymerase nucleotidyl transferase domain-containing protein n=1 Tax=Candidatus Berkelbacteria bacterium Gr01-1014_85 TaxID=2017150 RepID=A0A554JAA5_9BACT|nr:MAG: hypothetical protein CEO22_531 [Candidatus Berkelbacteria bacterium Gr01-1014_85]